MSQYFAVIKRDAGYAPVLLDGYLAMFDTVVAAEEIVAPTSCQVYDITKFEVPVPLVAPGTPVLANGVWIVSK